MIDILKEKNKCNKEKIIKFDNNIDYHEICENNFKPFESICERDIKYYILKSGIKMFYKGFNDLDIKIKCKKWFKKIKNKNINFKDVLKLLFGKKNSAKFYFEKEKNNIEKEIFFICKKITKKYVKISKGDFINLKNFSTLDSKSMNIIKEKVLDNSFFNNKKYRIIAEKIITKKTKIIDKIILDPNKKKIFYDENKLLNLNIYKKRDIEQIKGEFPLISNLIKHFSINNTEKEKYLYSFFYYVLKGIPCGSCPVIMGVQGAGKSILLNYLMIKILGSENTEIITQESLTENWNTYLKKQYVFINEISFENYNLRRIITNKLKNFIDKADNYITVKEKFKTDINVALITNFSISSNFTDTINFEKGDRRFVIFNPKKRLEETILELKNPKFEFKKELEKELKHFCYYVLNELEPYSLTELENIALNDELKYEISLKNDSLFISCLKFLEKSEYEKLINLLLEYGAMDVKKYGVNSGYIRRTDLIKELLHSFKIGKISNNLIQEIFDILEYTMSNKTTLKEVLKYNDFLKKYDKTFKNKFQKTVRGYEIKVINMDYILEKYKEELEEFCKQ